MYTHERGFIRAGFIKEAIWAEFHEEISFPKP